MCGSCPRRGTRSPRPQARTRVLRTLAAKQSRAHTAHRSIPHDPRLGRAKSRTHGTKLRLQVPEPREATAIASLSAKRQPRLNCGFN
jgi:hypothetical protein